MTFRELVPVERRNLKKERLEERILKNDHKKGPEDIQERDKRNIQDHYCKKSRKQKASKQKQRLT